MQFIFDLDDTIIDAKHRGALGSDGSGDLNHWRKNCTPEKIMLDSALPFLRVLEKVRSEHTIIICTSRVFQSADYQLLRALGISWDHLITRPKGCEEPCAPLKLRQLAAWSVDYYMSWEEFTNDTIMFDDNTGVQSLLRSCGMRVICPINYNQKRACA